MTEAEAVARLRAIATYGGVASLLLVGLGAFVDGHATVGWSCATAAAGILFRDLLHIVETRLNQ